MEIANNNLPNTAVSNETATKCNTKTLLTSRLTVGLAIIAGIHALFLAWSLAAPGIVPLAGVVSVRILPYLTCAVAIIAAALSAPLIFPQKGGGGGAIGPAFFAAIWQAAALAFFLMIDARLTPLSPAGILRAVTWFSAVALVCLLLVQLLPRAYTGIAFFWIFALPVATYLLAEIFLMTPNGSSGWQQAAGPQAQAIRSFVSAMLSISPATGAAGALSGILPDGSDYAIGWPVASLLGLNVVLLWRLAKKPVVQTEPVAQAV